MSIKDESMMHFQDLYASPAKSDASSFDIYDGLDMETLTEEPPEPATPSRDCLDLYEEILTEEGTAKEASLNDLSAEYEKCQRQMKQLITKLKEMQSMNTSLQNENQCLKKNISALIKTARVEISRKEEEIDRLNQRLFAPGNPHHVKPVPLLLHSMNKTKFKDKVTSKITGNMNSVRQEGKPKDTIDASLSNCPRNVSEKAKTSVENSPSCSSIKPYDKQCNENVETPSQKQFVSHNQLVDNKIRKGLGSEVQDKDTDQRQRKEGHRSNTSNSTNENSNLKDKTKCGKSEGLQERRNSKLDVSYETNSRKYHSDSHDKLNSKKDKTQQKEPHHAKEKAVKISEKCSKESKECKKEKNNEQRHRAAEKDDEPRRSKRTHISNVRDESHQKCPSFEKSDGKKSIDVGRREKRSSEYSDSKYGNQDAKLSKNDVDTSSTKNKHNYENKSEKCDWDRRGGEKKRSRDEHDRSRHDRKNRGYPNCEKEILKSSSKGKGEDLPCKSTAKSMNCEKGLLGQKENNSEKDLKLSFMETLNLTLSPAKKKTNDINPVTSIVDVNKEKLTPALSSEVCVSIESVSVPHKRLSSPKQMVLNDKSASVEEVTTKTGIVEDSKPVSLSELVLDNNVQDLPKSSKLDESSEALAKLTLEDQPVELDAPGSEELETRSVIDGSDFIDLDSFIEIDKCSGSESPISEKLDDPTPSEHIQDEGILEQACEDVDNKTSDLRSYITETTKGTCDSSNTDLLNVRTNGFDCNQCFHDESSFMSSDLNFVRLLPKVVSPLKSPVKSLGHLHTAEFTDKTSVVSILYKETHPSTPCLSLSLELNKENCKPTKSSMGSDIATDIISAEMEEGEVISEEENQCISSRSQTDPDKETIVNKMPLSPESELVLLAKRKQPAFKIKNKAKKCTQAKLSVLPNSTRKKLSAATCLDGVLKIIPPLSIQDVLQMLRIIRDHTRKKYMKFKMQVSVNQFHRFVEAATLCFITLVSNLDWSNLCSSPEKLQSKLCKHIDSRLKKLKKNGIVDRIFEQRLIDMKKRLWKFVDDQLDCLLNTLKAVILKLCDKAKAECDDGKKIKSPSCARTQISDHNSQKSAKQKNKACLTESVSVPCLRRLEFSKQKNADTTKTKLQIAASTSVKKKVLKPSPSCELEKGITQFNIINLPSKHSPNSPEKIVVSTGLPKSEQNSTGLSFNLVSDDHMGDIFKSLLHDSDQLELNTIQENLWLLQTPEKQWSSTQKYETVDSITETKIALKANFPWSSISPPHISTLPRLDTVLNPDVLDESCLLEVPTSSSKSITSSEERPKLYSVLLEDLAVSLTVPSPLKSDSHLSFLRPDCDPEFTPEVNVHCNEDSFLDEEDAVEQDIHLTLDSDNSSIDSLENASEPGGFQCHPSEPMQAVIMEKSNDHFIVKIRRAVSSSSPASDGSLVEETGIAASEQVNLVKLNTLCENVQREIPQMEAPDLEPQRQSDSVVLCLVDTSYSEVEKGVEPLTCSLANSKNISETNDSVFKSPETICQNSTCTLETTTETYAEEYQIVSEEIVIDHIEEIFTCPTGSPVRASDTDRMGLHLKKRKLSNKELPAKRQKQSPLSDTGERSKAPRHSKTEEDGKLLAMEKSNRKHKRALSDNTIDSKHSPSSLSAKNVIKKKGEVVVSWTRGEDREILLECQKLGPNEKTFEVLSSKMNKYPNQVEERFRQLMKLFKKSKNCTS